MTRKEEFKKKYQEINWEVGILEADWFSSGVAWADEHPSEETIEKVINLSRRWSIANEGTRTDYIKKHWNND